MASGLIIGVFRELNLDGVRSFFFQLRTTITGLSSLDSAIQPILSTLRLHHILNSQSLLHLVICFQLTIVHRARILFYPLVFSSTITAILYGENLHRQSVPFWDTHQRQTRLA